MLFDVEKAGEGYKPQRWESQLPQWMRRSSSPRQARRLLHRVFLITGLAILYVTLARWYLPDGWLPLPSMSLSWRTNPFQPARNTEGQLVCPDHDLSRYNYLRHDIAQPTGDIRYFFTLSLFNKTAVVPMLVDAMTRVMTFVGPENCALSIVEGRSTDGTREQLESLKHVMASLGVPYTLATNDTNPIADGVDRVAALAGLRNHAMAPLFENRQGQFTKDTDIISINDIGICAEDILELIHQKKVQGASQTCAMDWKEHGDWFYDVWVSRGMSGDSFFNIPPDGSWDYVHQLFWNDPESLGRLQNIKPFQVFSCYNGVTVISAAPFLQKNVRWRAAATDKGECYMGEPTMLAKDFWRHGFSKIAVVPTVNVAYHDADETLKVKQWRGYTRENIQRALHNEGDEHIVWKADPPAKIKCVPNWDKPSWVDPF